MLRYRPYSPENNPRTHLPTGLLLRQGNKPVDTAISRLDLFNLWSPITNLRPLSCSLTRPLQNPSCTFGKIATVWLETSWQNSFSRCFSIHHISQSVWKICATNWIWSPFSATTDNHCGNWGHERILIHTHYKSPRPPSLEELSSGQNLAAKVLSWTVLTPGHFIKRFACN